MELERNIPFDTPENIAKNIVLIIQEEAKRIGAKCSHQAERNSNRVATDVTVDVSSSEGMFRLFLSYADEGNLQLTRGRIGIGFITAGQDHYDLELIPHSWETISRPFHWQVSCVPASRVSSQTTFHLDGSQLRRLLRRSLSSVPQQLP